MKRDSILEPGFYWVLFYGQVVIAEYTLGHRSRFDYSHWHVTSSPEWCINCQEIDRRLSDRLLPPCGDRPQTPDAQLDGVVAKE